MLALLIAALCGPVLAQSAPDWASGTLAPPVAKPVTATPEAAPGAVAPPAAPNVLPPLLHSRFVQAVRAAEIKDWEKAREMFSSVLKGQPKHQPAVLGLGQACRELGDTEAAIEA